MEADLERRARLRAALVENDLDAFVCVRPANVLLLSGYWPVLGTSLAICTRDGRVWLLVPEDERALAECGGAEEIRTFQAGSLDALTSVEETVARVLERATCDLGLFDGYFGYEESAMFEPCPYAALHIYGASMIPLLQKACPTTCLIPADAILARMRSVLTPVEIARVRTVAVWRSAHFCPVSPRCAPA